MANEYTPSRVGLVQGNSDAYELFLKVYAGEVLTAFKERTVMKDRHTERTISSGKSAQFPVSGRINAEYHTPGDQLKGLTVPHTERVISIDKKLVSHVHIPDIDEAMNHYDYRRIYSAEMGYRLAHIMDRQLLQVGVLASRSTENLSGLGAGGAITESTAGDWDDATKLEQACYDAQAAMDELDVPESDRFLFLPPARYQKLLFAPRTLHADFNPGGNGSFARGTVPMVAGFQLVKTTTLPTLNIGAAGAEINTGSFDQYIGDFTLTRGLFMHKSAIATVKLMNLRVEGERMIDYQSHFMVAGYACGHGVLRPECAIELKGAAA